MAIRWSVMRIIAVLWAATVFAAFPKCAIGQDARAGSADAAANDELNRPVSLDVGSDNLYVTLSQMFDRLRVRNYSIAEELKSMKTVAHFTNVPLRTVLETLLLNTGLKVTVDGGVYSISKRAEEKFDLLLDTKAEAEATINNRNSYRFPSSQRIRNSAGPVPRSDRPAPRVSHGSQVNQVGGLGGFGGAGKGGGLGGGVLGGGEGSRFGASGLGSSRLGANGLGSSGLGGG